MRKWFVYMGDHHEGPFSIPEVQAKLMQRHINEGSHVWCEGMSDWKQMHEISEFSEAISMAKEGLTGTGTATTAASFIETQNTLEADSAMEDTLALDDTPEIDMHGDPSKNSGISDQELFGSPLAPEPNEEGSEQAGGGAGVVISQESLKDAGFETGEFEVGFNNLKHQSGKHGFQESISLEGDTAEDLYEDATGMGLTPAEREKRAKEKRENALKLAESNKARAKEAKLLGLSGDEDFSGERHFRRRWIRRMILLIFLALSFVAGKQGYLDFIFQNPEVKSTLQRGKEILKQVPGISDLISPLPEMPGISELDYADLLKTVTASLMDEKAKLDLAVSLQTPAQPKIYVVSNLPDGAEIEIMIVGREGTLLNRFNFSQIFKVNIVKNFALVTETLTLPEGGSIPQGEYDVMAYETDNQPELVAQALQLLSPFDGGATVPTIVPKDRKLFISKRYFMGGLQDAQYKDRLNQWNKKAREKAKSELDEIEKFHNLLNTEHLESQQRFDFIFKYHRNPKTQEAWKSFSQKSQAIRTDMATRFGQWKTDKFLYADLYRQIKEIGIGYLDLFKTYSDYLQVTEKDSLDGRNAFKKKIDEQRESLVKQLKMIQQKTGQLKQQALTGNLAYPAKVAQ